MRHTNQLPIGKHRAGALATVVQYHIYAGRQQFCIHLLCGLFNRRKTVWADRAQHHRKRCQSVRPNHAALVVVLLNRGRRQAGDTNAVTAHFHELRLAVYIQKGCVHGLAVFGAQIKYVAYLNAALNRQHTEAIGRGIARHHIANIGNAVWLGQITPPVHTAQVKIFGIGTTNPVAHYRHLTVGNHQ